MSTDIKPGCDSPGCFDHPATPDPSGLAIFQVGDTVRVLPTECDPKNGLHPNAHLTVEHADETHVRVSGSPLEWFARRFELVKRADATPAPLDPSKVKAGDMVTLTRKMSTAVGPVTRIDRSDSKGIGFHVDGYPYPLWTQVHPRWTLTDHQSAPEPVPTYPSDTVAWIVVRGSTVLAIRGKGVWWTGAGGFAEDDDASDVRPLVVIDPAGLREKVAEVLRARMGGAVEAWFDYADAVLERGLLRDPAAPAAKVTRAQVFDVLYPDGIMPNEDMRDNKIDALMTLFGGAS